MLYGIHVLFAVAFLAGLVLAAIFNLRALAAARPSQVVQAFSRVRPVALIVSLALLGALATGLVLVSHRDYSKIAVIREAY